MSKNDQLVDNDHISNSKADISISNGFSFGPATRFVSDYSQYLEYLR
ncbi:MAG: hypothetical protein IPG07_17535 [Crocinitomicaceae bacterium]|nr:hypothetical protein [Crocinitomicaceae bacterium]